MNTLTPPLSGSHLRTYDRIFQHPISHNLEWRDVRALFIHLGEVIDEPNGNLKVTLNGQTVVLHPGQTKDVSDNDELLKIRHFLERAQPAPAETKMTGGHYLVLIDHRQARIYRTDLADGVPQQILPHDPDDYFRHAHNSKDFSRGREKPDPNSFFEPVAKAVKDAAQILIFGTGTGMSSEMDQFNEWLSVHHADLSRRVIGCVVVDEHHLTEPQLLAKAKKFYASQ